MDRVDRAGNVEDLGALEEERPQLRIEKGEALVELDLRPVRLDLREVGIEREVRGQVRGDAVLEVDAPFRRRIGGGEVPAGGVDRAELNGRERRQDLDVAARRQAGQPFQHAHLGQEAGDAAGHGRPDDSLVLAADAARDLQPPAVRPAAGALRVAQALERNGHLRREPVRHESPGGGEQGIPRLVAAREPAAAPAAPPPEPAPAARVDDGVALYSVRVHGEDVRPLLIEKRVEVDGDEIVAKSAVAVRAVRADHAGSVYRARNPR